ncbi:Murein DD-endopeptidase MepM and murein hydrolase activator NlpD, contain LysM domain [Microbacterium sp. 8M]|uniref:M23 family metallopeptidase n=1 Tax=Microbacterium sp. 8M TaxID=2653153 RepID=UPI0012EF108A|nr:M23 family metallopeptidase [Microbacterium sp. 8M]VXB39360.1 Murein DD-endopeptidase MepM and murein hydrolase activator NlpD, contain LysM domain [Microbacterium sp. 8M]
MNNPNIRGARRDSGWTSNVRRAVARRRARRSGVALSITAIGALIASLLLGAPAAYADDYPSWEDVQAAKANEAAAASEVSRIQGLIATLTQNVADTKAAAEAAGNEYFAAQEAVDAQARRLADLQAQADAQKKVADDSASKAGQIAAQLSRDGGDTTALQLFFSKSTANKDELLQRLGQMDRVLAGTQAIYDKALQAKNTAQALTDQATAAKAERDRLAKIAEDKMQKAQAAADAAAAALANQQANFGQLQAQLAALQDTTVKTVAGYQAGEAARAAAEAARQAQLAAERQAAIDAARNNSGGGGGGGGGGGSWSGSGGWVRPFGGYQSSGYGPRVPDCDAWGCSSSFHRGVDLADGSCGSPIYAAHSGTVVYAGWNGGYGNYIKIDNGDGTGLATGYGHILNGGFNVWSGQWVNAGDVIAFAGNTGGSFGCHLHFEVYQWGDTINPITFMEGQGVYMG